MNEDNGRSSSLVTSSPDYATSPHHPT